MNSLEIHKTNLRMLRESCQEWFGLFVAEENEESCKIILEDYIFPLTEEISQTKEVIKRHEIDIV